MALLALSMEILFYDYMIFFLNCADQLCPSQELYVDVEKIVPSFMSMMEHLLLHNFSIPLLTKLLY